MAAAHVGVELDFDPGSYALLSEDPATDAAVVFVHGFGGHPEKTWRNFQELADSCPYPAWRTCDLYFFKYGSIADHIRDSSRKLTAFLNRIFPRPPEDLLEFPPASLPAFLRSSGENGPALRQGDRLYRTLVFCAHSEGSLVVRYTLLDLVKEFEDELEKSVEVFRTGLTAKPTEEHSSGSARISRFDDLQTILRGKLRLFAPAYLGASPSRLLGVLLASAGLGDFFRVLLSGSPAYQQMKGSELLRMIRENTESRADRYRWMTMLRALVMWGESDTVVIKGEYGCDREYSTEPGQTHISVCKPTRTYARPLEFVVHELDERPAVSAGAVL